jgi:beta-lactam-binding protein with PASTA domain
MTFRHSVRASLPYVTVIVAGLLAAYLVVAFVVFPSGVATRDAKVPNVTGMVFDDAAKRLTEVGFKAERGDQDAESASPKETVLQQDPPPGTREPEGTSVSLTTSAGTGRP